jgi:hypothetical protein
MASITFHRLGIQLLEQHHWHYHTSSNGQQGTRSLSCTLHMMFSTSNKSFEMAKTYLKHNIALRYSLYARNICRH